MTRGFSQIFSPGVHAMTADKKSVNAGALLEHLFRFRSQRLHVLAVLQNGQPFAMFVCRDTIESLQHLVTFDEETTVAGMVVRKHGAPHRMRVENGSCSHCAGDRDVEERLGGWLSFGRFENTALPIHFEDLLRPQPAFID